MTDSDTHQRHPVPGALTAAMTALAGTPEHAATVDAQLAAIARLAVERVGAVRYASITALRGRALTTVAVSDELIRAVDEVQYGDGGGPCVESLRAGEAIGVPDIDATVLWPGFHRMAPRMGLRASVSVPLVAGRGEPVAVLNLYSHDRRAMAPLIAAVCAVHGHTVEDAGDDRAADLDAGGQELVTGYAEALSIRATIRLAVELIRTENRCSPDDAYLSLCIRAAQSGVDLAEAATAVVNRGL